MVTHLGHFVHQKLSGVGFSLKTLNSRHTLPVPACCLLAGFQASMYLRCVRVSARQGVRVSRELSTV
jgi:hypothetical protein